MKGKRLVCLDIPDDYAYMQAELLHLLERKAGLSFGGTERRDSGRKKEAGRSPARGKGGPGVSPVRQGVRNAWALARGYRTGGYGRCG